MKVIVSKEAPNYSSEFVEHNGEKFKISCDNGNAYWHVYLKILTQNKDYQIIAHEGDIPNTAKVSYLDKPEVRIEGNRKNLEACKAFIKKLYA